MTVTNYIPGTSATDAGARFDGRLTVQAPYVAEFLSELESYLGEDTIVLTSVRDAAYGVVDIVLVGPSATIGFSFGRRLKAPVPLFVDTLFEASILDVAHGAADILYVAVRRHSELFTEDARLRLVPFCSSRILAAGRRPRFTYVGRGDDGQPILVRNREAAVAERSFSRPAAAVNVGSAA